MAGLLAVGYFLFALVFSLLSFVLWARIALRYFRISSLHPVSQGINKLTDPIVMPLSHLFTPAKKRLSRYDWPCFCMLVIIELLKFIAIGSLFLGVMMPWGFLPLFTLADLIVQPCNLLFYAIIIRVILSWTNPFLQNPVADIVRLITEPVLRLGRQIIPIISGFDFSPFIIMIVLKVITLFISASLPFNLL